MIAEWRPVVAVPARDEERRLPALVSALAGQTWLQDTERRLTLVVVLNNCTDRSREALLDAARMHRSLSVEAVEIEFPEGEAHVGSARRLALETALARAGDPDGAVLLTTDADAVPAPDWIDANLHAIARGADLVGGEIFGDPAEEERLGPGFLRRAAMHRRYTRVADRLASLIDPLEHDPWPRHRDHTAASLAVRGDVYRAVGGLPAVPFREDLAFVGRVRAAGFRLVHPTAVRVCVSARLAGRAPGGMADCLKDWMRAEAEGRPLLVEAPDRVEARLLRRRNLRGLAGRSPAAFEEAADALGLDSGTFRDSDGNFMSVSALIERIAPDEPDAPATMPVDAAIAAIEGLIAARKGQSFAA